VLRKMFQDKRFRIALSYAINRKDAINVVYVNQGQPAQPAPLKQTKYYDEAFTTQYTQYDPKQANSLLDEMGLTKKDSSGMRLRPDGKPLLIAVEVVTALQPEWTDYLQLVKKYWAAVGVNMVLKEEERSIFYARKLANEHDAGIWGGDGGLSLPLEMRWYFPFSDESIYAVPWALWFQSNGKTGEEPPAETKKQMDLYNQVVQTGDPAKQDDLIKQILAISKDQFYCIGLSTPINGYGIQRNDFHNVTQTMFGAWLWPTPGPDHPEQYFTTRTS
jgi:peptide/nickel transport system substrate-binding protein